MAESGMSTDTDCGGEDDCLVSRNQTTDSSMNLNTCDESSRCVRCHSFAKLMCERCGDRYCSNECQARDWIRHKKICFPLLFMHHFNSGKSNWPVAIGDKVELNASKNSVGDSIDEVMQYDEILFLTPRELRAKSILSGTTVHITSIVNHKTIFVRPHCASADDYLSGLFDDIALYGECNFRPLNELPKCGGIYLTVLEDEFYRVFVLAAPSRNYKIDVFFVDFGNTDSIWLSQLSELSDDLKRRSILLNRICLANVPEITFNENPLRFLNQLYEDEVEFILIFDQMAMQGESEGECRTIPKICHLKFVDEELTVNRKLIRLNSNVFSVDLDECTNHMFTKRLPIFTYDITYLWIEDYNVEMKILQNSKIDTFGYLTCIRRDKRATFDRNMAEIAEYGKNLKRNAENNTLRPSLHEVCLIENTERRKWYRAFCADPNVHQINCNALMVLLDFDDVLQIPYKQIWKLPPTLAFPVLPIDCFIRELIPRPQKWIDQLNLQNEFKLNRNILFDSMKRIPHSMRSASVSYKKIRKLIES